MSFTAPELARLEKLADAPEFLPLLEDYAKDLADPKASPATPVLLFTMPCMHVKTLEEREAYLRQLEAEQDSAEGEPTRGTLAAPAARFVIKARCADGAKIFVNLCSCDKVGACHMAGGRWHVPTASSAKAREGADAAGQPCRVWDLSVHPAACQQALASARHKAALVEIALGCVEKAAKVSLQRPASLPRMRFKTTPGVNQPAVLNLGSSAVPGDLGEVGASSERGPATADAKLCDVTNTLAPASTRGGAGACQQPRQRARALGALDAGFVHASGEVTPPHVLVWGSEVDLGRTWGDAGCALPRNASHPKAPACPSALPSSMTQELRVRVELPVESAAEVEVDVQPQRLLLRVPGRLRLDLPLPLEVLSREARATFDTDKQQLEVVMLAAPLRPLAPPDPAAEVPGAAASTRAGQQGSGADQLHACGPAASGSHAAAKEASASSVRGCARDTSTDLLHGYILGEATRHAAIEAYAAGKAAATAPELTMLMHTTITELGTAPAKLHAAVCIGQHSQEEAAAVSILLPQTVVTELAAAAEQHTAALCIAQHSHEGERAATPPSPLPHCNIREVAAAPAKQRKSAGCVTKHSQAGAARVHPLALLPHTVITELDNGAAVRHTAARCHAAPSGEPALFAAYQGPRASSEGAAGGGIVPGEHTAGDEQNSQQGALHAAGAPTASSNAPMGDLWSLSVGARPAERPAAQKERGTELEGPLDEAARAAAGTGAMTVNERLWLRVHAERDRAQQDAQAPGSAPGHAVGNAGLLAGSGGTAVAACASDAASKRAWEAAGSGATLGGMRASAASPSFSGDGGSATAQSTVADDGSGAVTASFSVSETGAATITSGKVSQEGQEQVFASICTAPCPMLSGQATKVTSAGKGTSQASAAAWGDARDPVLLRPRMGNVYADDLM